MTNTSHCIFCRRSSVDVEFDREHVIPQSVGGALVLTGAVCKGCNGTLGREVDHHLLAVPDIFDAMDELDIPFNRDGVLKKYYTAKLVSGDESFKAGFRNGEVSLIPQNRPDGSRIVPEGEDLWGGVRKTVVRDPSVVAAGIGENQREALLIDLRARYDATSADQEVKCPELGLKLVKRSDALEPDVELKSPPGPERAVAKAAFEFLWLVLDGRLLRCAPWSEDLMAFVHRGETSPRIQVFRSMPQDPTIRPVHYLLFTFEEHLTRVVLGLFGGIEYQVIAPSVDSSVLQGLTGKDVEGEIIGVAYEQNLENPSRRFFLLAEDGCSQFQGEY